MLIEDDRSTRIALTRLLSRTGVSVEVAASVSEAMAALAHAPDLVVLDLMLPDGDGATVLRAIRASGLPSRIAVTTGASDPVRLAQIRSLNPDALLFKPVRLSDLLDALGLTT